MCKQTTFSSEYSIPHYSYYVIGYSKLGFIPESIFERLLVATILVRVTIENLRKKII